MTDSRGRYILEEFIGDETTYEIHDTESPEGCGWRVECSTDYREAAEKILALLNSQTAQTDNALVEKVTIAKNILNQGDVDESGLDQIIEGMEAAETIAALTQQGVVSKECLEYALSKVKAEMSIAQIRVNKSSALNQYGIELTGYKAELERALQEKDSE